jgi:3',5'-cyclic AMP phosphodiesterase CpdA
MFTLAHLSDVHLAPLPRPQGCELLSKRAIGFASWYLKRKKIHRPDLAERIMADIKAARPDHIALTGDLINISLRREFAAGTAWLKRFGSGEEISFVPGNHDAYVHVDHDKGIGQWSEYMAPDVAVLPRDADPSDRPGFPYVRQRRNIALIGVSTGVPAALHRASGTVGPGQLKALALTLKALRERGYCRIVMIHHPPLPGQCVRRRGLDDCQAVTEVLKAQGAEFVLHGHNHMHMHTELATVSGRAHVLGVPSASAAPGGHKPAAAWYHYQIRRQHGLWQAEITVRGFDEAQDKFVPERTFNLAAGQA